MNTKLFLSVIIFIYLSSFNLSSARPDISSDDYYSFKEMLETIYKFEELINQSKKPTIYDYQQLFGEGEGIEDRLAFLDCLKNFSKPCTYDDECLRSPDKYSSKAFEFLRSKEGPFFNNSEETKIKIYIYYDSTKNKPSSESYATEIDALMYINKSTIVPCRFYHANYKGDSIDLGKISRIYIRDKELTDIVTIYLKANGINSLNDYIKCLEKFK